MTTWKEMSLDCFRAAQVLRTSERWRSCINRSYYAAYGAVTSSFPPGIAFARGWKNPGHEQLPKLVWERMKSGREREQLLRALKFLRRARENADYRPGQTCDEQLAVDCLHYAAYVCKLMEVF